MVPKTKERNGPGLFICTDAGIVGADACGAGVTAFHVNKDEPQAVFFLLLFFFFDVSGASSSEARPPTIRGGGVVIC